MLKTSSIKLAKPRKGEIRVGGNSKVRRGRIDNVEVDNGKVGNNKVGKKGQKTSKSKNSFKSKKTIGFNFFTLGARLMFTKLKQVFIKVLILHHFDLKRHIRIETNVSSYTIGRVLSQLILDDLGRWHPVAFISHKMILVETRYKTYNSELLAIVQAFKTLKYYSESFQHEVLVLTKHNNLCQFMNTKSLSYRQVYWAQEFSCYYF